MSSWSGFIRCLLCHHLFVVKQILSLRAVLDLWSYKHIYTGPGSWFAVVYEKMTTPPEVVVTTEVPADQVELFMIFMTVQMLRPHLFSEQMAEPNGIQKRFQKKIAKITFAKVWFAFGSLIWLLFAGNKIFWSSGIRGVYPQKTGRDPAGAFAKSLVIPYRWRSGMFSKTGRELLI